MKIHMYYVIGWHVDIDVLCIMFTCRHTCVMQYIYMKAYMHYVIYLHDGIQALAIYSHYVLYNLSTCIIDIHVLLICEHEDVHIL